MKKTNIPAKQIGRLAALVLVVAMLMSTMLVPAFAVNSKVQDTASGVLQMNLVYRDDSNKEVVLATGTCFLINDTTVVTCSHCVSLSDEQLAVVAEIFGKSVTETAGRIGYSVTIARDVTLKANMKTQSQEVDFAVLTLDSSLKDRKPLALRPSKEVQATEDAYAIGFPGQVVGTQDINKYTADDVTITNGKITKALVNSNKFTGYGADFIQTSCKMTHGVSGGPMVDENGYVVGVCAYGTGEYLESDDYYYAVCIDQVRTVLDSLGIMYTLAGSEPAPTPDDTEPVETTPVATDAPVAPAANTEALNEVLNKANALAKSEYTAESFAKVENAILTARTAMTSGDQNAIDTAKRELESAIAGLTAAKSNNNMLLIIIAAVAVVVILIVVILVAATSKKKKTTKAPAAPARNQMGPRPGMQQGFNGGRPAGFAPPPVNTPAAPVPHTSTAPLSGEAGATTVLTQGAGETTVLSKKVNGGTLVRRKNGEQISVNLAEFLVGRERKRVTYCVSDNTSIGRVHAKFVVRNGVTYLVDMNSTNGTFVNGVKAAPNQEIALKTGDKVTLADEEFDFRA